MHRLISSPRADRWSRLVQPRRDERGVSAIIVGLSLAVLVGALGMSVDIGNVAYQKTVAQDASDAAAIKLATTCAKAQSNTTYAAACSASQSTAAGIVTLDPKFTSANVTASANTVGKSASVQVSKSVATTLLGAIPSGPKAKGIAATSTATWGNGSPTQGYPVLPLGVSYCTWQNNSTSAGTSTESSKKFTLRTDTLQAINDMLIPVTSGLISQLLPISTLAQQLTGTKATCTDPSNSSIVSLDGAVWLVGEQVISGTLGTLFNWTSSTCTLKVGTGFGGDLNTFLGATEGSVFMPSACAAKFGTTSAAQIQVGSTILLPVYKPYSNLQTVLGLKAQACYQIFSGQSSCAKIPPQLGVNILGFAPFKVTGWNYTSPGTVGWDSSLCSTNTKSIAVSSLVSLLQLVGTLGLSVVNALLGTTLQLNLDCSGLQGYFTKSFTKDPNFTWSTNGPDQFGADYVKLTN